MELPAGQSFNNTQLLKCLHQPDCYLLRVFQKLIKHQGNGKKFCHGYVSVGYNVWNSNCKHAGKDCVILTGTLHGWGKAGKPLPSGSGLEAAAREVVTAPSKPLLALTAGVSAKEWTKNCSVEVPDCFMWYSKGVNPKSSYRLHPDPWVKAVWINEQ